MSTVRNELVVDGSPQTMVAWELCSMHQLLRVLPNLTCVCPQGEPETNQVGLEEGSDFGKLKDSRERTKIKMTVHRNMKPLTVDW